MKKRKCELGGLIDPLTKLPYILPPIDTTRVQAVPIQPLITIPEPTIGNTMAWNSGSSKSKSKMRFRERSLGGDLLQTGVSFIPGVGQILSPLVGLIDEQMDQDALNALKPPEPMKLNQNPFGKLAKGGILNDNFKQYSTGSHASGNDLSVDVEGNPVPNGENTVQNRENSFKVGDKQYVFSDVLKKDGIPFNKHAMNINKKYPKARFQLDQRSALDLEMEMLAKENDIKRVESSNQKAYGGTLDNGDPIPASSNLEWNAQSLYPITVPSLFPQSVNSMGVTKFRPSQDLGVAPDIQQVNADAATLYGTPGMIENNQMAGDGTLATDSTTFGQELTPVGQNLSEQGIAQDRNNPIVAKNAVKGSGVLDPKTANALGLGMKGLALAGSVMDALSPAEKEKLILPDYTKADNYIQSANIDYTQAKQDAQGVSNIAAGTNRSLSSNAASYQGREQSRLAGLSDALGRISEAENNGRSQLNLTKGNYEAGKAADTANRKYQNQQGNMANEANSRFFDRSLMSDLSQIGSSLNQYGETQKVIQNQKELNQFQVNQQVQLLNAKYPNVKVTPDIIEKLKRGATIDDILKISI